MLEEDIEDTHLCIKCSTTIVGLENYIQHRKNSCTENKINRDVTHADHPYGTYDFSDTSTYHHDHHDHIKSEEVEKPEKSLSGSYDPIYDLGADVFFSSLELQSSSKRTATGSNHPSTSGGKHHHSSTTSSSSNRMLTRKATAALLSQHGPELEWIEQPSTTSSNSENLMKAVRNISGNKKCEPSGSTSVFKLISYHHDSPEPEPEEEDDDDDEDDEVDDEEDEDDEDYGGIVPSATHTGGKWKPSASHTGGKWKPSSENNLLRNSPSNWDERHHSWENISSNVVDEKSEKLHDDFDHDFNPPPGHTKGKWVPGTKVIKLDYKEEVEIEKIYTNEYWCNICNRKLSSKILYERHLKSNLHLKRSEPEQELEQAAVDNVTMISERMKKPSQYLNPTIYETEELKTNDKQNLKPQLDSQKPTKKRKRRKYFIKCETCKTRLPKYLLGKHLISHYHYRRMLKNPTKCYDMILDNMHRIVRQAPYQCQPCQFYANTEEDFLLHWNTSNHRDLTEGPGRFWCSFCKFECEDNNQMRRHLLSTEHKEVVLAINRSVPIIIGKKVIIDCSKCKQNFRYNFELRKHSNHCTGTEPSGTASNDYQSKFVCNHCKIVCRSQIALQKHELIRHQVKNYFCSICKMNFNSTIDAKRHRQSMEHRIASKQMKKGKNLTRKCRICEDILPDSLKLKEHLITKHPEHKCSCPHCGELFTFPQEVGRHIRDKKCNIPSTSKESKQSESLEIGSVFVISPDSTVIYPNLSQTKNLSNLAEISTKKNENSEKNVFICSECDYRTSSQAELLFHEIFHKPNKNVTNLKIPCPICNKEFRKHSLKCHLRQHTNERIFTCDYCQMGFTRKYNLKTHIVNCHENKKGKQPENDDFNEKSPKYQCDTCGKFFKKRHTLLQHISIHGKRDKRFSCPADACIFIGRDAYDLKTHMSMVHSEEKNFKCNYEGCDYTGKTMALLKKHIRKHNPIGKEISCPECNFTARIPTHMRLHMRVHTAEKPYKCPYCSYTCNLSDNLRKHVLSTNLHPGKYLYECNLCDTTTQFKTNFQREFRAHLVLVHKIEADLSKYLNI